LDTATSHSKTRESSSGYLIKNRLTAEANAAFEDVSPSGSPVLLLSALLTTKQQKAQGPTAPVPMTSMISFNQLF